MKGIGLLWLSKKFTVYLQKMIDKAIKLEGKESKPKQRVFMQKCRIGLGRKKAKKWNLRKVDVNPVFSIMMAKIKSSRRALEAARASLLEGWGAPNVGEHKARRGHSLADMRRPLSPVSEENRGVDGPSDCVAAPCRRRQGSPQFRVIQPQLSPFLAVLLGGSGNRGNSLGRVLEPRVSLGFRRLGLARRTLKLIKLERPLLRCE